MLAAVLMLALLLPSLAAAQPRKVDVARSEQTIGSWMLSCAMDPMTDTQVATSCGWWFRVTATPAWRWRCNCALTSSFPW